MPLKHGRTAKTITANVGKNIVIERRSAVPQTGGRYRHEHRARRREEGRRDQVIRVRVFFVPLPPLDEQRRIVANFDELMTLCDQLEANLSTAVETGRRLLDALLAEALVSAESADLKPPNESQSHDFGRRIQ